MDRQTIKRTLDLFEAIGYISSYDLQTRMPGVRWTVRTRFDTFVYGTRDVVAFIEGASCVRFPAKETAK